MDSILSALISNGGKLKGNNPWIVDTQRHGIVLKGIWEESKGTLSVEVLDKDFFVPCSMIWEKIDPMVAQIAKPLAS